MGKEFLPLLPAAVEPKLVSPLLSHPEFAREKKDNEPETSWVGAVLAESSQNGIRTMELIDQNLTHPLEAEEEEQGGEQELEDEKRSWDEGAEQDLHGSDQEDSADQHNVGGEGTDPEEQDDAQDQLQAAAYTAHGPTIIPGLCVHRAAESRQQRR